MSEDQKTLEERLDALEARYEAGERAGLRAELEELVRECPHSARAWNDLGAVLHAEGQERRSRTAFEQALALDSQDIDALLNLSELHLEALRFESAIATVRSLLRIQPYHELGRAFLDWTGVTNRPRPRAALIDLEGTMGSDRRALERELARLGVETRVLTDAVRDAIAGATGEDAEGATRRWLEAVAPHVTVGAGSAPATDGAPASPSESSDPQEAAFTRPGAQPITFASDRDPVAVAHEIALRAEEVGERNPPPIVAPILSVILPAGESPRAFEDALDHIALNDLPSNLVEVVAIVPEGNSGFFDRSLDERPFTPARIEASNPGSCEAMDAAVARASGHTTLLLAPGTRITRDALRRAVVANHEDGALHFGLVHFEAQQSSSLVEQAIASSGTLALRHSAKGQPLWHAAHGEFTAFPTSAARGIQLAERKLQLETGFGTRLALVAALEEAGTPLRANRALRAQSAVPNTLADLIEQRRVMGRDQVRVARTWGRAATRFSSEQEEHFGELARRQLRETFERHRRLAQFEGETLDSCLQALAETEAGSQRPVQLQVLASRIEFEFRYALLCGAIEQVEGSIPALPVDISGPMSEPTLVIMTNRNGFPHVKDAVESLARNTEGPYDLLVVDDASTDGSREWLQRQKGVRVLAMPERVGAPAARNAALAGSTAETIFFSDNDVIFTSGWRSKLMRELYTWSDVGAVGPVSDGAAPHQRVNVPADADPEEYAARLATEQAGQGRFTHHLATFGMLARRAAVEAVGAFDTAYGFWGFEDTDWCLRARLLGFEVRVASDCFIRHLQSQTMKPADYEQHTNHNWSIFKSKFGLKPSLKVAGGFDVRSIQENASALKVPFHLPLPAPSPKLERTMEA